MNKQRILSGIMSVIMIGMVCAIPSYASETDEPAVSENFSSYADGTDITANDSAWLIKKNSNADVDTFARVETVDGKKALHFGISEGMGDVGTSAVDELRYSVKQKLAPEAENFSANYTVDFEMKLDGNNLSSYTNKWVENYISAGDQGAKGAYVTMYAPKTAGEKRAIFETLNTNANGKTEYFNAVDQKLVKTAALDLSKWHSYRVVVHSVSYTENNTEKTADYAEYYVDGMFAARVAGRFAGSEFTNITFGFDTKYTEKGIGMYISNVKVYDYERTEKAAESCDCVTYVVDKIDFSADTLGTHTSPDYVGNGKIKINGTDKTVDIAAGSNGKAADDRYLVKTSANSADMQLSGSVAKLNSTSAMEISFDYMPLASQTFSLWQRVDVGPKQIFAINNAVNNDGKTITFFGETYKNFTTLSNSQWYNIKLVVKGSNDVDTYNKGSVYINNIPVVKDADLTKYAQLYNSGVTDETKKAGEYAAYGPISRTDLYGSGNIDNLFIKRYSGGAWTEYSDFARAEKGMTGTDIYAGDRTLDYLAEDCFNGNAAVKEYKFADDNGTAVTDISNAKYCNVTLRDGTELSLFVNQNAEPSYAAANIEEYNTSLLSKANNLNAEAVKADFGRGDNEGILLTKGETAGVGKINAGIASAKAQTVEFYFMSPDTSHDFTVATRPTYNGKDYDGGRGVLWFNSGNIRLINGSGGSVTVGTYKANEWIKAALTVISGSDVVKLRLNGETYIGHYKSPVFANGYFELQVFDTKYSIILDDIKLYNGISSEKDTKAGLNTSGFDDSMLISGRSISLPYKSNPVEFDDYYISDNAAAQKLFINKDGEQISVDEAVSGDRLVFKNDGILSYYTLNVRDNAITQIPSEADGKVSFIVDNDGFDTKLAMFNAAYDGETLVSVSMPEFTIGRRESFKKINLDCPEDDGKEYKIFLWDNSSQKPLSGVCTYTANK